MWKGRGARTGWFADPNGSSTGAGSIGDPWDLQTAFDGGYPANVVQPGDTVWLRGGTYNDQYTATDSGTNGNPITYRSYTGEWAKIDGNVHPGQLGNSINIIAVTGSDLVFRDFEIMDSGTIRSIPGDCEPYCRGDGININGDRISVINMVIHDCGQGVVAQHKVDHVIYGNLLYYNGWFSETWNGVGHNMYLQNNEGGSQLISDNLSFDCWGLTIQAYGSSGSSFQDCELAGNVCWRENVIIGGLSGFSLHGTRYHDNRTWALGTAFGYNSQDLTDTHFNDNYCAQMVGNVWYPCYYLPAVPDCDVSGNTFIGGVNDFREGDFPDNTYISNETPPTSNVVFVRANAYEANRANIAIFNWEDLTSVSVNLDSVVADHTSIVIRNAQDWFGTAVYTGTYHTGTPVSIPMTGLTSGDPVGFTNPGTTGPAFACFVVREA